MPKLSILPGGSSGGSAGLGRTAGDGVKRGAIRGWSAGAARRNVAFLWSVDTGQLPHGEGWAITLTMGSMPDSHEDWHAARQAIIKRLIRGGAAYIHWVIEWTAKGRPHLHMAVYGDGFGGLDARRVALVGWLEICDKRGWQATGRAQHIVPIHDATGWLEYVAKHAARGASHYQREGMPPGWEKTGHLWGTSGEWPVEEPLEVELTDKQFHRYRRLMRGYQRAKLRNAGASYRVQRRVGFRAGDPKGGRYMGVSGWIPQDLSTSLVLLATADTGSPGRYEWEN